jgi:hypothetical protein
VFLEWRFAGTSLKCPIKVGILAQIARMHADKGLEADIYPSVLQSNLLIRSELFLIVALVAIGV